MARRSIEVEESLQDCIFCSKLDREYFCQDDHFAAFFDAHPIALGHALVIPNIHSENFFDLDAVAGAALYGFIKVTKEILDSRFQPDGFNIGINSGRAAGQTIFHTHIHVIPRYLGDVEDPRGGVRTIFPQSARCW